MGTLFNQPERCWHQVDNDDVIEFIQQAINSDLIENPDHFTLEEVIAIWNLLERRRENDLKVENQDVLDEQLAGFGKILRDAVNCLDRVLSRFGS